MLFNFTLISPINPPYIPHREDIFLPDLPPCTVLTTPDVVQHFGGCDEKGQRFVEFASGNRRYFPRRLTLKTVKYQNPLDGILVDLLTGDLLYARKEPKKTQPTSPLLFNSQAYDETLGQIGRRIPFYESQVLHQFCSSPSQILILCKQLENGNCKFKFQHQARLTQFIRDHQSEIERAARPKNDVKLNELVKIIEEAKGEKVTVFCHHIETAFRLKDGLKKRLRRLKVETTARMDGRKLDEVLQSFAPVANEVPEEDRSPADELQVLICTNALSEGFNLQDSRILVNYDLPWTVLQLAQRMGRILRPWSTPRDVLIYNFIPSTMEHPRLCNARRWQRRLLERSEEHRSFAQIPVLIRQGAGGNEEEGYEMEQLASELFVQPENDLDLDEVLDFIQNADTLTTSTFYKDLANIANPDEIEKLPCGIRSARLTNGKKRLFVLFHCGRQVQAGLFGADGNLVNGGDRRDIAMQAIRCEVDEPKAPVGCYPEDDAFDAWIEKARRSWARSQEVNPQQLQIVCAMALIPKKSGKTNHS